MKRKKVEGDSGGAGGEAAADAAAPPPLRSYEEAFVVVEKSVEELEKGDLSLEDSLRRYERGLESLRHCYAILQKAQKRIEVLGEAVGSVVDGDSGLEWKPGSSHPALRETIEAIDEEEDVPGPS